MVKPSKTQLLNFELIRGFILENTSNESFVS